MSVTTSAFQPPTKKPNLGQIAPVSPPPNIPQRVRKPLMTVDSRNLFQAIARRDLRAGETALRSGANPNARDMHSFTPIHYAALRDQPEMIESLIRARANPNALGGPNITLTKRMNEKVPHPEESSPLLLAAWYANTNAMRVLANHLPHDFKDGDKPNAYGFSLNYCVLANQLDEFRERFPPTKYTHEIYRAKMLAHVNGISGHISLQIGEKQHDFCLEGGMTYGMYKEIADSLEELPFEDPILTPEMKREIIEVFRKASRRRPAREIFAEIKQGKLTILPTGWHGHYQSIVFYRSHMIMIDGNSVPAARYFQFIPDALTEKHIENLHWGHSNPSAEGDPLKAFLTANPSIFPRPIEHSMHIKNQSVGNCSHYAPKHALRASIKLLSEKLDKDPQTQDIWKFVKDWSTYFRIVQFKKYLVGHRTQNDPEIPEDRDLVKLSWSKIYRHSVKVAPSRQPFFNKELITLVRHYWTPSSTSP